MYCVSISHKKADVEIRRLLAFSAEAQREFLNELLKIDDVSQAVIICTCNRTEVYFCGKNNCTECVTDMLAKYAGISSEQLSPYVMFFQKDKALYHLFRVACGIESMVLGEDEILGQTKNAYIFAKQFGAVKSEMNMIFQSAIACAKRIKTDTKMSKTSVSTATLAANEAVKFADNVNVMIIGATGDIGQTVLKNLLSHNNVNVTATLRSHNTEVRPAENSSVRYVDYLHRYDYIDSVDCVISATSGPHYTITKHDLEKQLNVKKSMLFIDLAVPPDIEKSISCIDGIKFIGIDYFECLAKENNEIKVDSIESAKQIISNYIDLLKKDLIFHDFLPEIEATKKALSAKTFEQIIYKFKSECTADQLSAVLNVLKQMGGNS